nr:DUF5753 domain-containing protein [Actinoallomurus purpureus]
MSIRCFATQVVPGLLQTEDYARAVMDPNELLEIQEARVAGRMERQAILTREKPPMSMFVLDESVLRRSVGSAKVMVDQIDHLIGMAQSPCVQVRIMLFERITSVALGGGFILLSFQSVASGLLEDGRLRLVVSPRLGVRSGRRNLPVEVFEELFVLVVANRFVDDGGHRPAGLSRQLGDAVTRVCADSHGHRPHARSVRMCRRTL